jgi:pilus assembly protein CpaE
MADVIGVISTIFVDPDAAPLGKSIAFVGAKGGVGSSTLAHNCAWSISASFPAKSFWPISISPLAPPT